MTAVELASAAAHLVGYIALAVLAGGLLFVAVLWPAGSSLPRIRGMLAAALAAGLLTSFASVGVLLWRADGHLTLRAALTEEPGRIATSVALLWALAAVVVAAVMQRGERVVRTLAWRVGAVVVVVGLLRATGMSAHAGEAGQPAWGVVADLVHTGAVSAWIGGLLVLSTCLLPRKDLDELAVVVPRFSKVAKVSVLLAVISGVALATLMLGSVDAAWQTEYGRVLLAKVATVGLVMLAALASKGWVENRLASAAATRRTSALRPFAVSVAAETVLVVAVLAAASVLVTSSPGV